MVIVAQAKSNFAMAMAKNVVSRDFYFVSDPKFSIWYSALLGGIAMSFRILSFDGGIHRVITAQILKEVEQQIFQIKGQSLHQYFDLIAGTSTM